MNILEKNRVRICCSVNKSGIAYYEKKKFILRVFEIENQIRH